MVKIYYKIIEETFALLRKKSRIAGIWYAMLRIAIELRLELPTGSWNGGLSSPLKLIAARASTRVHWTQIGSGRR